MSSVTGDASGPRLDAHGSVVSMIDGWTYLVGQYPNHEIQIEGPVRSFIANVDNAFLNMLLVAEPVSEPAVFRAALAVAGKIMASCPYPTMLASVPAWYPADGPDLFERHGFAPALDMWGMAASEILPSRRSEPDIDWRKIHEVQGSVDIGLVNAAAYDMDPAAFAMTENLHQWSGQHFAIVGYEGDTPVTAALAYVQEAQIYVGWVATLPDRYGRGLGEAAMRRAIVAAQEAAGRPLPIWLHATEMGRPLYRNMGFADTALMRLHTWPGDTRVDG
ncbi:GNAT family N-acetyltransferase [Altererythrobacter sp. MTPC7]|uniref:GNAT family N-acetyltransferase n=1 Tax=Erythrobacteraceae TaxID=335929 RepID=UPI0036F21D2A